MQELSFVKENKLGLVKYYEEFKQSLKGQFSRETSEVGLYLAMARVAQRQGYPEVAEVLKVIAWEEAEHAAQYAELMGKVSDCTKTNISNMIKGEVGSNKLKAELAQKAKDAGLEELYILINPRFISGVDEDMLNGLLQNHNLVITLEDGVLDGGFGEKISRFYSDKNMKVLNFGATKEFINKVDTAELYNRYHLTEDLIVEDIKRALNN